MVVCLLEGQGFDCGCLRGTFWDLVVVIVIIFIQTCWSCLIVIHKVTPKPPSDVLDVCT